MLAQSADETSIHCVVRCLRSSDFEALNSILVAFR
jgi:hypothetical protein